AFFVEILNWRYVFWMNLPLGLLSMIGIICFLHENVKKEKQKIDYIGTILMIAAISLLMYIFVEGGVSISWTSIQMYLLVSVSILTIIVFYIYENKVQAPVMPSVIWEYR